MLDKNFRNHRIAITYISGRVPIIYHLYTNMSKEGIEKHLYSEFKKTWFKLNEDRINSSNVGSFEVLD